MGKKSHAGRKPLPANRRLPFVASSRISKKVKLALLSRAKRKHKTLSEYIRERILKNL